MIASNHAEVKFAVIPRGRGIFHDKFGLIDSDQETIFLMDPLMKLEMV